MCLRRLNIITHRKEGESVTISERINKVILAAIHYRNRELIALWITSVKNQNKLIHAGNRLEHEKNALLTAISKGAYIK